MTQARYRGLAGVPVSPVSGVAAGAPEVAGRRPAATGARCVRGTLGPLPGPAQVAGDNFPKHSPVEPLADRAPGMDTQNWQIGAAPPLRIRHRRTAHTRRSVSETGRVPGYVP